MVLGALHLVFLWLGDILLAYGVAGLVLLLLHPLRSRTASVVGAVMLGLLSALIMVTAGGDQAPPVDAAGLARLLDDYRSSFLEAAQARIEVYGLIGGVTSTLLSALMVVPPCSGWRRAGAGCWRSRSGTPTCCPASSSSASVSAARRRSP
ncbi:hypothetical protein ACFSKW_13890 [Nonomuraea mangrovi]|uniref:Uncharacterized protein n=1 Tax=Nonomuraea mangrovi TaxID=2316207 RepID=A0ABW4SSK5_9ACTN